MITVDYQDILEGACDGMGWPPEELAVSDGELVRRAVSRALGRAWKWRWWQGNTRCEQRQYRASWEAAVTYALETEVYDPATDAYYESLQANNTNHAVSQTAWWVRATGLDTYVAWNQTGQTLIAQVKEVWDKNPRTDKSARPAPRQLTATGIQVLQPGLTRPWIEFRTVAPRLTGAVYDSAKTYTAGQQVYSKPHFYNALASCAAGESPGTAPAKWQAVEIAELWSLYLINAALAALLQSDGQSDKAGLERDKAQQLLDLAGLEDSAAQGERPRTAVRR